MSLAQEYFQEVFEDRTSGSTTLLSKLQQKMLSWIQDRGAPDRQEFQSLIGLANERFNAFAVILHFLDQLKKKTDSSGNFTPEKWISDYIKKWEGVDRQLANTFISETNIAGKTLMLHSNSGTITNIMKAAHHEAGFSVIQTESRPAMEGRNQAEALARCGISVTLITEAMIAEYLPDCDLAVCGADAIYEEAFINKTGTHIIAHFCRAFKRPFYVICDPRKKRKGSATDFKEPVRPASEIWDTELVKIHNHYFETIPLGLVTRVFS